MHIVQLRTICLPGMEVTQDFTKILLSICFQKLGEHTNMQFVTYLTKFVFSILFFWSDNSAAIQSIKKLTEQTYLRLLSTFNYANSCDKNVNIKFQQNIKHSQSK